MNHGKARTAQQISELTIPIMNPTVQKIKTAACALVEKGQGHLIPLFRQDDWMRWTNPATTSEFIDITLA